MKERSQKEDEGSWNETRWKDLIMKKENRKKGGKREGARIKYRQAIITKNKFSPEAYVREEKPEIES